MPDKESKQDKKAAALKYSITEDHAPKIIAKGQGKLAEKIISLAQEENIPIHQNQNLIELLLELELGEEVPEELYEIVAEILSFIYTLEELE